MKKERITKTKGKDKLQTRRRYWLRIFFLVKVFIVYLFILAGPGLSCGTWDLLPWPGMEPRPPALGAQSLIHWTSREVPWLSFYICLHLVSWLKAWGFWVREEIDDLLTLSVLLPIPSRQHTEGRWAREELEIQGSQSCRCQWLTHPSFPLWTWRERPLLSDLKHSTLGRGEDALWDFTTTWNVNKWLWAYHL